MMNKLEKYCTEEIEAIKATTFMFQLHECAFFDKIKFREFLLCIKSLTHYYLENGKTKYYETILCGIVDSFSYIMQLFYCHLDPDDLYLIENYHDIKGEISSYFEDMRLATRNLIAMTSDSNELDKQNAKGHYEPQKENFNKTQVFEDFDFTNFWKDSQYARSQYVGNPPNDELIAGVERELGYKLPASYIELIKQQNGGIPAKTCLPVGNNRTKAITGIFGIDRNKPYSVCGEIGSRFMIDEWGYPAIGVAICSCPSAGHDMVFLDYRECGPLGEPKVVHVDQESDFKITLLAENFECFIRGLKKDGFM